MPYKPRMDLIVWPEVSSQALDRGIALFGGTRFRCALGRSGVRAEKREGDAATPAGRWPIQRVLYRADRLPAPTTRLPLAMIARDDGWCDDSGDARYNRPVQLPHAGGAERLWRDDGVYDIIAVLAFNQNPVVPDAGSAIFLHLARPDYGPTEGCVALAMPDLLSVLEGADATSRVCVQLEPPG